MRALFITKPFFIEPLGIMYLIAAAKRAGFAADLITTDEDIDVKIKEFKPDVLCYSIMTGDQDFYSNLHKELFEKYKIYGIAGGPHPTFFPEMIQDSVFQCICRGEGEVAFVNFLKNNWDGPLPHNFHTASSYEAGADSMYPLIGNLDSIAFPDRECVFKYPHIYHGPIKHFIAGRGCPYNCTYCFNASYAELYNGQGKRVRLRHPNNLMREIKEVVIASPTQLVYFQDDTFILNTRWLSEFLPLYRDWTLALPFHCHVRANLVNDEVVSMLSDAGCYSVHLAIESGDPVTRAAILGRDMTNDRILQAVECLKNHNIKVMTQNMIGLPFTTIDDDIKTLKLNQRCKPTYAWASIFQPYPRTKLGEEARAKGLYTGDFSDIGSSFFDETPLNLPEMHKNQIAGLQKLFALAVELPQIFTEEVVRGLISIPGYSKKELLVERYKQFRKIKDRELYGVDL